MHKEGSNPGDHLVPFVPPFPQRHTTKDLPASLVISIPSYKKWSVILSAPIWLAWWGFFEYLIGRPLALALLGVIAGESPASSLATIARLNPLLLLWLAAWTLAGLRTIYGLLWQLTGKEVIEVSRQSLRVRRPMFGIGFAREISFELPPSLRVLPEPFERSGWRRWLRGTKYARRWWGLDDGVIEIRSGTQSLRFGRSIDEAEAKDIVSEIRQRFPEYTQVAYG
jgi:hypothetical protein